MRVCANALPFSQRTFGISNGVFDEAHPVLDRERVPVIAAVMGMSNALYSGITFKGGAVEQSNFTDYNVARMSNFPKVVNIHIVDGPKGTHSGGIGEPGIAPMIGALCNAVFAASKKRIRSIPFGDKIT